MTKRTENRTGFSLVELVAALAIFGIAVVAVLELTTTSLRATRVAEDGTRATFLAQAVLEETLAEGLLLEGEQSGEFGAEFPNASWRCIIEQDADNDELYAVTVTVEWPGGDSMHEFRLATLAAER